MWKVTGCCCLDLEIGGRIIGWLGAVSTFYYLFASVNFGVVIEECLRIEKHKLLILEKENQGCSRVTESDMTLNTLRILGSLIGFVIYFLLLFGINSRNHTLVLPVIFKTFTAIIFEILVFVYKFWIEEIQINRIEDDIFSAAVLLTYISVSLYFTFVLYSLYEKIKLEKEPPRYSNIYA